MKFDVQNYPYNSKRNVIFSKNGMCASGNPQASAAGLDILKKGGNAVDAIVAMAAALPIVEPTGNGIGADNFALIHMNGKLYGFNGSGPSPKSLSYEALKARGYDKIPSYGVEPIDVPGAPAGWAAIHERFGTLSFEEVLQPAIDYARFGYVVQPNVARLWDEAFTTYSKFKDNPQFQPWFDTFADKGRPYEAGEIFKSED
ncbi:MAG: gamma-glutamyltransferase, partial [Tissierellia bacterium]|nr:gamma-glutamyltransferase [Tissierellia bacterium]